MATETNTCTDYPGRYEMTAAKLEWRETEIASLRKRVSCYQELEWRKLKLTSVQMWVGIYSFLAYVLGIVFVINLWMGDILNAIILTLPMLPILVINGSSIRRELTDVKSKIAGLRKDLAEA